MTNTNILKLMASANGIVSFAEGRRYVGGGIVQIRRNTEDGLLDPQPINKASGVIGVNPGDVLLIGAKTIVLTDEIIKAAEAKS